MRLAGDTRPQNLAAAAARISSKAYRKIKRAAYHLISYRAASLAGSGVCRYSSKKLERKPSGENKMAGEISAKRSGGCIMALFKCHLAKMKK